MGLSVVLVALRDGPGHVLAVSARSPLPCWERAPAATRHRAELPPRRKRGRPGTAGKLLEIWVKKAESPNKVGMRNPIGAGSRFFSSGRAGTSCGRAAIPALPFGFFWDKPGPRACGVWLSIWPDLVSRDLFVTGLGSLQLQNRPRLMPLLQRKEDKEKRLESGL